MLAEVAALLAVVEVAVRALDLDGRILAPLLYYATADFEVHRVSADEALRYELRPGASADFGGRRVSVNALGLRGAPAQSAKAKGVLRVVFAGGSNTYGASVGDSGTYPAQLQARLARRRPGRYAVWNAGVSAYTPIQTVAAARRAVRDWSPDLVVLQLSNCGRRAFLRGDPTRRYFERDPDLFRENLRVFPRGLGRAVLNWRTLGALVFGVNHLAMPPGGDWNNCEGMREAEAAALARFLTDVRPATRVAVLIYPAGALDSAMTLPADVPVLRLREKLPKGHTTAYLKPHPSREVYAWYAQTLEEWLESGILAGGR